MKPKYIGFLQALGIVIYCSFIGLLMGNGDRIFGNLSVPLGPVLVLLLFSASALICGIIVLYKPYKLFNAGKKKEALETVLATTVSLLGFVILFLTGILLLK